jgi:MFS-type transporter involved in bile tolerance (Atg22 family)
VYVDVSSFSFYTTSISVGLQALFFISLGAVADHGCKYTVAFCFFFSFFLFLRLYIAFAMCVTDAVLYFVFSLVIYT